MRKLLICFTLLLTTVGLSAQAQDPVSAIITTNAPIYLRPDATRTPLRVGAVNTSLRVLDEVPEGWVHIEFMDPQYGVREGYVETRYVRVERPTMRPMDLSIRPASPAVNYVAAPTPTPGPVQPPAPRPVTKTTYGYLSGMGGVTFQSETSGLAGIEMGGTVHNLQFYGQVGKMFNTLPKSIQSDLDDAAKLLSAATRVRWQFDGKIPVIYYGGGVKFLVPTGGPVRPYVLGGMNAAHLNVSIKEVDLGEVTDDLVADGYLDATDVKADKFGFETGGGVLFELPGKLQLETGYRFMKLFNSTWNVSRFVVGLGGRF